MKTPNTLVCNTKHTNNTKLHLQFSIYFFQKAPFCNNQTFIRVSVLRSCVWPAFGGPKILIYIYMYTCIYENTQIYIYIFFFMRMYIYIYIYIYVSLSVGSDHVCRKRTASQTRATCCQQTKHTCLSVVRNGAHRASALCVGARQHHVLCPPIGSCSRTCSCTTGTSSKCCYNREVHMYKDINIHKNTDISYYIPI